LLTSPVVETSQGSLYARSTNPSIACRRRDVSDPAIPVHERGRSSSMIVRLGSGYETCQQFPLAQSAIEATDRVRRGTTLRDMV